MNLRNFLLLNALVALLFALGLLLGAPTVLGLFKLKTGPSENLVAQLLGAALLVPALLSLLARDVSEPGSRAAVVLPLLLFDAIGFVISLLGVLAKTAGQTGWLVVILFLLFTLGFGYFQFVRTAD
jgi:hypothetical protein